MSAAAGQIQRIRAAGVPVCLDDFGAGSASFRYLRELRVDYIKIDGSYVRETSRTDQGRSFVSAMRDLAASTGAETIAEMIETEADAALMRKLGISLGQGWLFGKPGPLPVAKPKIVQTAAGYQY
jgi:EAL domain-containing protein (putative c-di-GMP-specific phosphodiesterase class I)